MRWSDSVAKVISSTPCAIRPLSVPSCPTRSALPARSGSRQLNRTQRTGQQRLLLEYGYPTLHAAKERRETLRGADVGVFLGIMNTDFNAMFIENDSVYAATGGTISIAAGRLCSFLARRPCASYDTACSSVFVAAHAAASAMRQHECISGLVLTVSLMLSPQVVIASNANLTPCSKSPRSDQPIVSHGAFALPDTQPIRPCRHAFSGRTLQDIRCACERLRVAKVLAHSLS